MTAPDMRIQRVQVALFCRINLEDKLTLAAELRRRNHERFDGEPIMFPPSPGATSGLPAFSLQSKDGNHTLTVSSHRVDAVSQYELASRPVILDAVANEKEFVLDLVATLSESEQVDGDVNRIGVLCPWAPTLTIRLSEGLGAFSWRQGSVWGGEGLK